jgi:hypothetical protein
MSDGTVDQTMYDATGRAYLTIDRHTPGDAAYATETLYDSDWRAKEFLVWYWDNGTNLSRCPGQFWVIFDELEFASKI